MGLAGMFCLATGIALPARAAPAPDDQGATTTSAPAKSEEEKKKEAEEKEKTRRENQMKRDRLTRELAIAKVKIEQSKLAAEHQREADEEALAKLTVEHDFASKRLKDLSESQAPLRVEQSKLNLRWAEDSLREAEEELQQLEMMYAEEDLADKTKEIVIQRAKRRIERSRVGLENAKKENEQLTAFVLPNEIRGLSLEVEQKQREISSAKRSRVANELGKRIELMSAEAEVARMEAELEATERELAK
jgi:hypothetical protein